MPLLPPSHPLHMIWILLQHIYQQKQLPLTIMDRIILLQEPMMELPAEISSCFPITGMYSSNLRVIDQFVLKLFPKKKNKTTNPSFNLNESKKSTVMKKITLIALALFFSIGMASAQFISFGIKGGLNYSNLRFDDVRNITVNSSEYNLQDDESFQGFHLGVMSRIKVLAAYIQPELYFNTAGGKVLIEEVQSGGATVEYARQIKYSKVDLPVLLGFKLGPVRINGGPVASVILSEDNTAQDIIPDLETMSKTATIGFQIGAGVDLLKFLTLDYRFEGGLSKYGDGIEVGDNTYPFDSRANIHLVSLGVMF